MASTQSNELQNIFVAAVKYRKSEKASDTNNCLSFIYSNCVDMIWKHKPYRPTKINAEYLPIIETVSELVDTSKTPIIEKIELLANLCHTALEINQKDMAEMAKSL